ncbi:hypothetical protein A3I95_01675 [Candidatus Nomurabacteria bacterium RIFCSPLOWO2_02_FULL_44_12]|uniref:Uncharacterized protein n=1 Tax=Candidatus Nomurabacteria bacterium RIFCSPLOWO2_12_FULL_44_11 TaxID=1801796 RepID=A0A1F6Y6F7_9BACT|nr:MAG: hypothetical protein A3E95_01245 [Candidatus Nomurabacteria bacterium RIFCSPHIGHO2_12_FULL_44_22b]OGJ01929.1 MAG: hypothetical protein A3G53_01420 [Candidatus Nomurabacteria bacterium RIFCSPLOWO2_12_FULL_44_11]OGJ08585.1 MAG: hypothetical protein A3I95_01675 [Candidatus Nomurabacteria bacterium RIFCSPLOWO2_02_FULL_44_12]
MKTLVCVFALLAATLGAEQEKSTVPEGLVKCLEAQNCRRMILYHLEWDEILLTQAFVDTPNFYALRVSEGKEETILQVWAKPSDANPRADKWKHCVVRLPDGEVGHGRNGGFHTWLSREEQQEFRSPLYRPWAGLSPMGEEFRPMWHDLCGQVVEKATQRIK